MEQNKINKLKDLYDLSKPEDLFTLFPQEMEVMEVKALAKGLNEEDKKKAVIKTILEIAKKQKLQNIQLSEELLSTFFDIINNASKGKYALNKG